MLKKGKQVMFVKPMSTMRRCLEAVEQGNDNRQSVMDATGLRMGQVRSALYNLTFIGAVHLLTDKQGRSIYTTQAHAVAPCLCGVSSIFAVGKAALPR
jgi:hypothetical protein